MEEKIIALIIKSMYSSLLLRPGGVQIKLLKNVVKDASEKPPSIESVLSMAKAAFKNQFSKEKLVNNTLAGEELRKSPKQSNKNRLVEVQDAICKYFEEERKEIFIDISKLERKGDTMVLKFIKRDESRIIESRQLNELAKLIRYKLKRLPDLAQIKRVVLAEDNLAQ